MSTPPSALPGVPDQEDSPAAGLGGPSPNPAPSPVTTTAPPQPATTGSTLSSILHAVGDALGGPKTGEHGEPISNAARVLHGVGTIAQGVAAGAAQHGPGSIGASGLAGAQVVQKQAQQQKENTLANQKQDQEQLMNKATIAYHNNQMLLQQREADRMDTELTSKIGDANRAFETVAQEKGWQKPPIMVDGKDINGTPGNEDAMMKYYTDPANHKAPDGYTYAYLPTTDDKGKASHAVYLAPVNSMDQMVKMDKSAYKEQTGIDVPSDVSLKLGDLINQRSMFAKSQLEGQQERRSEQQQQSEDKLLPGKIQGQKAENASKLAEANLKNAQAKNLEGGNSKKEDGTWDSSSVPVSLVEGTMDPSQMSKRGQNYNSVIHAANQYSMEKYGKPFDMAQAGSDYKYATNAQTQNTLKMINGMAEPGGAIEIAQTAASKLPAFPSATVNKVFNAAATEFGSTEATNFHTAMLGLADEYSKVMGGGVSSDTGRQQSLDLLKKSYSEGQLKGAIDIMHQDISARKKALVGNNRYLQKQYGTPPSGPGPTSHVFSLGTWQKANPNGDPNAAKAAAQQAGYQVTN